MKRSKSGAAKVILATFALSIVAIALIFNTSTRYGRWLFWQDADWGDIDRFAFLTVEYDPETVIPLPVSENQLVDTYRIGDLSLSEYARKHDSSALVILHDDSVVLEDYYQGYDRESYQPTFSVTKSVVSILVGIAIRDGLIDSVHDPIGKYVQDLDQSVAQLTIHQLLTMTSGISDEEAEVFGVPAPWSDDVRGYYDPDLAKLATTFILSKTAGTSFEYHDFNPILVARVLEEATGKSPAEYLSEQIWRPAGMEYSARWSVDSERHGFEKPESGLNIRAIDMARLGRLMLDDDPPIVPAEWLDVCTDSRSGEPGPQDKLSGYADRAFSQQKIDESLANHIRSIRYGYYWWIVQRDGRTDFYANGRFGQFIYICPKANLVVVRCGPSHGGLDDFRFGHEFFKLGSAILDRSSSEPE
jgi:CubicO group peptidase (beta-lactamase class C family)